MRAVKVEPKELRRVVIAAAVGNIIEWYDFYIFGSLASILAVKFFEKGHPVAAFLSTVAIFSVGFLIRVNAALRAYQCSPRMDSSSSRRQTCCARPFARPAGAPRVQT